MTSPPLTEILILMMVEGTAYLFFPFRIVHQGHVWDLSKDFESASILMVSKKLLMVSEKLRETRLGAGEVDWRLGELGFKWTKRFLKNKLQMIAVPFILCLEKPIEPYMTIDHWFGLVPSLATCARTWKRRMRDPQPRSAHTNDPFNLLPLWGYDEYQDLP